jgi:hypothetical protein
MLKALKKGDLPNTFLSKTIFFYQISFKKLFCSKYLSGLKKMQGQNLKWGLGGQSELVITSLVLLSPTSTLPKGFRILSFSKERNS